MARGQPAWRRRRRTSWAIHSPLPLGAPLAAALAAAERSANVHSAHAHPLHAPLPTTRARAALVNRFRGVEGCICMHAGLPCASGFPLTSVSATTLPLTPSASTAATHAPSTSPATHTPSTSQSGAHCKGSNGSLAAHAAAPPHHASTNGHTNGAGPGGEGGGGGGDASSGSAHAGVGSGGAATSAPCSTLHVSGQLVSGAVAAAR